jgi:hypothetical protein
MLSLGGPTLKKLFVHHFKNNSLCTKGRRMGMFGHGK